MRFLLIEDNSELAQSVSDRLKLDGHAVDIAGTLADASACLQGAEYDLMLLDIMLPDGDGVSFLAQHRATNNNTPVIATTARSAISDRVSVLDAGADDYITKPFSPREMVARVEAILRRSRTGEDQGLHLKFRHVILHLDAHEVYASGEKIVMTPTEFKLLRTLMKNHGAVLSREQLVTRVWGSNYYGNDRVVDVYVGQVRRKLEEATGEILIETVRGVGYKFIDEPVL